MDDMKQTRPRACRSLLRTVFFLLCTLICTPVWAQSAELPVLSDATSGTVSIERERQIGDRIMQGLRKSPARYRDVQIQNFTELLLFKLAKFSQLQDRNLRVTLINDPTINAFAVPGGVIGIHLGLFLEATTEAEFSAVLAHEIAHLSQRHHARNTEAGQRRLLPYLAGLLGSVVLLSQGATQAGLAGLHATQAASIASGLSYSRGLEKEADRVGIKTLYDAGIDPNGMADMFVRMKAANRHNSKPPEFLLTHPVHENRISDARNQATGLVRKDYSPSLNYHLMRARAESVYINPKAMAIKYQTSLQKAVTNDEYAIGHYGFGLALIKSKQFKRAQEIIGQMVMVDPYRLPYLLLQAELWIAAKQAKLAIPKLQGLLQINPDNLAITQFYITALVQEERFKEAQRILKHQTLLHPKNVDLWYDLAEISGLAKDIISVHRARAEFFILRGDSEQAIKQLKSGLRLISEKPSLKSRLEHRLKQVKGEEKET